jgi:protease-4
MHKKIVVLLLALFFLAMAGLSIWQVQEKGGPAAAYGPDTVGVIEINGAISAESPTNLFGSAGASSDDIMDAIKTAREREDIKVLLLRINSPGLDSWACNFFYYYWKPHTGTILYSR